MSSCRTFLSLALRTLSPSSICPVSATRSPQPCPRCRNGPLPHNCAVAHPTCGRPQEPLQSVCVLVRRILGNNKRCFLCAASQIRFAGIAAVRNTSAAYRRVALARCAVADLWRGGTRGPEAASFSSHLGKRLLRDDQTEPEVTSQISSSSSAIKHG